MPRGYRHVETACRPYRGVTALSMRPAADADGQHSIAREAENPVAVGGLHDWNLSKLGLRSTDGPRSHARRRRSSSAGATWGHRQPKEPVSTPTLSHGSWSLPVIRCCTSLLITVVSVASLRGLPGVRLSVQDVVSDLKSEASDKVKKK